MIELLVFIWTIGWMIAIGIAIAINKLSQKKLAILGLIINIFIAIIIWPVLLAEFWATNSYD